jgi:hypothetical protein
VSRRRIALLAAAAAAIVVVALTVTLGGIDAVVERAIEERGSAMTQTAVEVGSVQVSLRTGTATLRDLTIANPPGFKTPYAFELGEITVHLAVGSLIDDPLRIREIRIGAPRVSCELQADGKSNVEMIRKAVERAARAERRGGDRTPGEPKPARADRRRMIIDVLAIRDGEVYVDARAAGGPEASEKLPGFELTGIGAEQNGVTPPEVGRIVITALARDVAVALAATKLERYIGEQASEWLKKGGAEAIRKGLGDILDQVLGQPRGPEEHR